MKKKSVGLDLRPSDKFAINDVSVYFTYTAKNDIVIMRDSSFGKLGKTNFFLIDGHAKKIFERLNGKSSIQQIMDRVRIKEKIPAAHRANFEKAASSFVKSLLRKKIILKVK